MLFVFRNNRKCYEIVNMFRLTPSPRFAPRAILRSRRNLLQNQKFISISMRAIQRLGQAEESIPFATSGSLTEALAEIKHLQVLPHQKSISVPSHCPDFAILGNHKTDAVRMGVAIPHHGSMTSAIVTWIDSLQALLAYLRAWY
jgi:hypothetical protein